MKLRSSWIVLVCFLATTILHIGSAASFAPLEPAPVELTDGSWPIVEHHDARLMRWSPQGGCQQQAQDTKKAPLPMILLLGAFFLLHATGYARIPEDPQLKRLRDP